jgi:hypothetical protein
MHSFSQQKASEDGGWHLCVYAWTDSGKQPRQGTLEIHPALLVAGSARKSASALDLV